MMIPVLWVSRHDDVLCRGNWDHGMIEALLDRQLWRVPGAFLFVHYEQRGEIAPMPESDGGVVVVSGRNHAHAPDVAWLNRGLARLAWALLIVAGDEEAAFPYSELLHPRLRVWGMGAMGETPGLDRPLGSGWPPWFPDALPLEAPERMTDVAFAGQVTHERRRACVEAMRALPGSVELIESAGFTQGVPPEEYAALLARTKVAPCPSGPESPDSFRLYEALEAGCIPIADGASPHGPMPAYWTFVFGESPPFREVGDWSALPTLVEGELAEWEAEAPRLHAWWQGWKRDLAWNLARTVGNLTEARPEAAVDEAITVIIPTSPAPIHPSLDHISEVIGSVRAQLPNAEILIGADGVRAEQRALTASYREYLRRLVWACDRRWSNVLPVIRESWGHQANVARMLLERVRTPLTLFVEHDCPIYGEINWRALSTAVRAGAANVVRLAHESFILPEHAHLMVDGRSALLAADEGGQALGWRTVQWSQRPHLAATWWYRDVIDRYFAPQSRTMIEDVLHGVVQHDAREDGWERWRLWLYAPPGDDMKRSWHLDSRGDAKKYDMKYRYPERRRPGGAPPETM